MAASRRSSTATVDFDAALKKVSAEKDRRIDELSRELSRLRSRIREDSHQAELGRRAAGDKVTAAEQQLLQIQISAQEDVKEMKHKVGRTDGRSIGGVVVIPPPGNLTLESRSSFFTDGGEGPTGSGDGADRAPVR